MNKLMYRFVTTRFCSTTELLKSEAMKTRKHSLITRDALKGHTVSKNGSISFFSSS